MTQDGHYSATGIAGNVATDLSRDAAYRTARDWMDMGHEDEVEIRQGAALVDVLYAND